MITRIKQILFLICAVNFSVLIIYNYVITTRLLPSPRQFVYIPEYEDAPNDWQNSRAWKTYQRKFKNETLNGVQRTEDYCERVRKYRQTHPIEFDSRGLPTSFHKIYYSDYEENEIARDALAKHGQLVHQKNNRDNNTADSVELDPSIISFYTHFSRWHQYYFIGLNFLCEGQRYNHIPGNTRLSFKDVAIDNMRKYAKYYHGREHCFDPWTIFPFTYNLEHQDQCEEYKNILENERHSSEINWIAKKSRYAHRGLGVYIVNEEIKEKILQYNCTSDEQYIVQRYIKNPFLINNRKFDFRVYLVIASMDPLIILYRDGFIRLSPEEYDSSSSEKNVHLTNTDITFKSLKNQNITDSEKQKIIDNQSWSLEELEEYMVKEGYAEKGWLDRDIRKFIKWMMFHLVRMNLNKLLKHPRVYELFGLDFLMDTDLHLWFLEANLQPAMVKGNEMKTSVYYKMMEDLLDLELALQYNADFDAIFKRTDFHMIFDGRKSDFSRYHDTITLDCV